MATETTSDGLIYSKNLRVGYDELAWEQAENAYNGDIARRARLAAALEFGLVPHFHYGNIARTGWKVIENGGTTIGIELGSSNYKLGPAYDAFVDYQGYLVFLEQNIGLGVALPKNVASGDLTVPNDNTWYTVVVSRDTTQYERGTLTMTAASATLAGVGTAFQRFNGKTETTFARGTKIRIDASDSSQGNEGEYEVDTIASDTSLALTAAVNGGNESGVPFTVIGEWLTGAPADKDLHQRSIPKFEVIARTRQPPAGKIILADVKRNDAAAQKVEIIDRRYKWFRPTNHYPLAAAIQPRWLPDTTTGAGEVVTTTVYNTATVNWCSVVPYGIDGLHAVVGTSGSGFRHYRSLYSSGLTSWSFLSTIDASGTCPCLVELPRTTADPLGAGASSLPNLIVFYVKSNALKMRTYDGSTWSAETAVWTPATFSGAHTLNEPAALLARDGRLHVVVSYYDGSTTRLRYVYSDDYGTTWSINGHNGYAVSTSETSRRPSLAQAPDGNLCVTYDNAANAVKFFQCDNEQLFAKPASSTVKQISPSGLSTFQGPAPMYVGRNGNVCALMTRDDASYNWIWEARPQIDDAWSGTTFGEAPGHALLRTGQAGLYGTTVVSMCQDRGGDVHVLYTYMTLSVEANHLPCLAQEYHAPKPAGVLY